MTKEATIRDIAKTILGIETLECRNSDALDFHEIAVWKLRAVLEKAFDAGKSAARTPSEAIR